MRTEKQIKAMLKNVEDNDTYHTIILKDVGIEEIKTVKDVLRWVLDESN